MSKLKEKEDTNDKPRGIEEGPPIWVESCMTPEEIEVCRKKYNTYTNKFKIVDFATHARWRYGMGRGLSLVEIDNINENLQKLKEYTIAKRAEAAKEEELKKQLV